MLRKAANKLNSKHEKLAQRYLVAVADFLHDWEAIFKKGGFFISVLGGFSDVERFFMHFQIAD